MRNSITKRVDAITHINQDYMQASPPCPRAVKIELTARCDFKCWFCATGSKLREARDMDFEFYDKLLDDLKRAGVEEIGLFYLGESFLYKQLPEAVKLAKDKGFPYVFLTTNGRLATADRVRACMEAGLDSLKFSFNFADAVQFKDMTQVDAFDKVVKNIHAARAVRDEVEEKTGHRCGIYASSILYDGEQRDRMQQAIDKIKDAVDEHYFLPLYSQAGLTGGKRGTKPLAGNPGRVGALREPVPCWSLFTEARVTFDGHLSACCFDHDGRFRMGNLNEIPFMEAWQSHNFQKLRMAHLSGDVTGTACEKCAAYN